MKNLTVLLGLMVMFGCKEKYDNPHILITTQFGEMEAELYPSKAPKSVMAFLKFVNNGLYDNSTFYRVLKEGNQPTSAFKTEIIQGGIWNTNNAKALKPQKIPHETTQQTGLTHMNGTLSLARTEPGSASTEFFICVGDQPLYDYGHNTNPDGQGYAAFGRVIKGLDVLQHIHNEPENGEDFYPSIPIFSIRQL
jgi:peptidyl-prolyl cis-trans isomerase A (cyclophilin A)